MSVHVDPAGGAPVRIKGGPTLGFLLHEVARLLRLRFEQKAKELGLTRAQWQTISYVSNNEGINQAALADMLEIKPITLVPILDKLEERKLVERRRDPKDRRAQRLYLEDAARPLLMDMHAIGEATRAEALVDVTQAERDQLFSILARMKRNLVAPKSAADDTVGQR